MSVLVADLKANTLSRTATPGDLRALPLAIALYREYGEDALVIASPPSSAVEGGCTTSWTMVYHSHLLGHMDFGYSTLPHGSALRALDIDALVVVGRSDRLKYIVLYPDEMEILPCEHMRAGSSASFEEIATKYPTDLTISTGQAADKGVWFGSLQYRGRNLPFSGAGHVFHLHNLKGIVLRGGERSRGVVEDKKDRSRFKAAMKECGEYNYIQSALALGWAPIRGYRDRFDPRAYNLDGKALVEKYGNYPLSCSSCPYSCMRQKRDGSPLPPKDAIFTLAMNLGFFAPEKAMALYDACRSDGLEVATTGAILVHLSSLGQEERSLYGIGGRSVGEYVALIHRLATGSLFYDGLRSLPDALQGHDHRAYGTDLRGDFGGAINSALGLPFSVDPLLLFPRRSPDIAAAAEVTLSVNLVTLALLAMGLAPCRAILDHWSKYPLAVYMDGRLSALAASRITVGGMKAKELHALGLGVYSSLCVEWHRIPSRFILDSESDLDSQTVPMRKLMEAYDRSKARLEISLKSRSEKSERPSGRRSPKVGPEEDLGLDAEPGLKK